MQEIRFRLRRKKEEKKKTQNNNTHKKKNTPEVHPLKVMFSSGVIIKMYTCRIYIYIYVYICSKHQLTKIYIYKNIQVECGGDISFKVPVYLSPSVFRNERGF